MKQDDVDKFLKTLGTGTGMVAGAVTGNPIAIIAAIQFFGEVLGFSTRNKETEFIEKLYKQILELQKFRDEYKIENLKNNELFKDTFVYVAELVRKSPKEKFEMLQNYLLHSALPLTTSQDVYWMYLQYVNELTPTHIKILKFFEEPKKWFEENNIDITQETFHTPEQALMKAMPSINKNRVQFVRDLIDRGLLEQDTAWLHHNSGIERSLLPKIQENGKDFLSLLAQPEK